MIHAADASQQILRAVGFQWLSIAFSSAPTPPRRLTTFRHEVTPEASMPGQVGGINELLMLGTGYELLMVNG